MPAARNARKPATTTRRTNREVTTTETPQTTGVDWDNLLETAAVTDRSAPSHRAAVEVPDKVIVFAQTLVNKGQRAEFAVDNEAAYEEMRVMWLSAGDKTTPPTSATVTPVGADGKKCADLSKVAKLRVSFGERRGARKSKTTKD